MGFLLYKGDKYFKDPSFPLAVSYYQQSLTEPHSHDFHELVIVLNGSGQHVTESLTYPISVGDVFVVKPMCGHYYKDMSKLKLINILYLFDDLAIPRLDLIDIPGYHVLFEFEPALREKGCFKSRLNLDMGQLLTAERIVAKLHNELRRRGKGYRFVALLHFMELLAHLSRCYAPYGNSSSRRLLQVSSMMSFIERNFMNPISLGEIIKKGHMSLSTANRAFREAISMTPINYLIKVRMEHAAKLLRSGSGTVGEVAMRCGFKDSNYFSKQFKQFMGKSPRGYQAFLSSPTTENGGNRSASST